MTGQTFLFGIRHHGPGSARRLVQALDDLKPAAVLIEGPAEASELLPMLADPDMATPVALLIYAEDDPANASFFPFAEYSPEYQAARWAVRHGSTLRFIDLPASDRLRRSQRRYRGRDGSDRRRRSDQPRPDRHAGDRGRI